MIAPSQLPHLINDAGRQPLAPRDRLVRRRGARSVAPDADVAIRLANGHDHGALRDLEQLDGRALPTGRRLLAELDGVPVAAIAVADDTVVADPFARTSAVVDLLRVRARQLRLAA